jgi:hypothetical protein
MSSGRYSSNVTHLASRAVVNSVTIRGVSTNLPREVSALTLGVEDTVVDLLDNSNILGINSAVLRRCVATSGPCIDVSLAEVVPERGAVHSGAVVRFADDGTQVEVEHAEIGTRENTVGAAV